MSTDRNGRAVVPMWDAGTPDPDQPVHGFAPLPSAEHHDVFSPSREEGAYNHHPALIRHGGRFHAIWSNHPAGEDGPGQQVLHASSDDGKTWTAAQVLFDPPGPVKGWHDTGLCHTAGGWLTVDGTAYALALLHDNVGYTDFDRKAPPVPRRDDAHPCRARVGYTPVARALLPGGTFGPPFPLRDNVPDNLAYAAGEPPAVAETLSRFFRSPAHLTHWDFEGVCHLPDAYDGHRLCEPTTFRRPDGQWVVLLRDTVYSHRMYVSRWVAASRRWTPAEPTDIPDSPSLTCTAAPSDGTVLLVGNQCAPAFDNWDDVTHYPRDPLTIAVSTDGERFSRAYALRYGPHDWNVPQGEVGGRGAGYQYPNARIIGDTLWVIYSIGKERIAVSRVPLASLGA